MISIIAAVSENGVIGRGNRLPWRLPQDLKRFRRLTLGHHVIVGRRTWESIGGPLPGRTVVVLSRQPAYAPQGVRVAASLEQALELASGDPECFVAGGAEVYRQALPRAGRLYLTRVHTRVEGDAFFPPWDASHWELLEEEHLEPGAGSPCGCTFLTYQRRV